jgi:hypothetical protein
VRNATPCSKFCLKQGDIRPHYKLSTFHHTAYCLINIGADGSILGLEINQRDKFSHKLYIARLEENQKGRKEENQKLKEKAERFRSARRSI